ncbi:S-layer domain protein [Thermoclostridium stercorarium subsp. stercorarium DSM 8532]|jgi:N-acetylmuramoyl-L-alanine amidase|uniref:S-layer domain protein n=4 Tax=Thermoclostridium stercorarium TaxID=1510 RepID=L7VP33_THES1|nr:S-layer homology domain-containing protein [Thermoclostridium stercorarium]AGC68196.1 S-layer domain protein [Thermoclostridium stercorarium subsp. stercorarium DSM 8532]AGI39224.1 SLH domain-containing protein [Thermoclostridium stercorarium subsp. stercorarium DSM 8532]ANW98568.1 S-layer protein [Thermoclostridium stercorarium subsp. thermolacticum DSM 2910]ANX01106.1 S-layer protein [Thermoclostridium stercorarium subsp. leptospartum DSM 9219]UZQ86723.1 S-layer homology domain-containing
MKLRDRKTAVISFILCAFILLSPTVSSAYVGSMGFEGGISAANPFEENTYTYREVCFLTGTPIILEGTMTVKKNVKNEKVTTTYKYNLENKEQNATITRTIVMETVKTTNENGQTTEKSSISKKPTEIVKVGSKIFELTNYEFTRSGITDARPAVYYNTGEYILRKTYRINSGGTITVEMTGSQYGYDQYWSSAKSANVDVAIAARPEIGGKTVAWGGQAKIFVSSVAKKGFEYVENQPYQISFEGGYVEKDYEESVLEYEAQLPEFDKDGKPTGVMKDYKERIGIESTPVLTRLQVPDLKHLAGYWAEEPVKVLFSLGIIPGIGEDFNPAKYITRKEFTVMVVRAIKDIPEDPDITKKQKTTARTTRNKTPEISPFRDVSTDDPFYEDIKKANSRGIIQGTGDAYFSPEKNITSAEAVTMLIRALGLESLAPYPYAVTPFVDNDEIPAYARNYVAVAYKIGLISGDSRGYFHPNRYMTYEDASVLLYKLIRYMGEELVKDYRERFLSYW